MEGEYSTFKNTLLIFGIAIALIVIFTTINNPSYMKTLLMNEKKEGMEEIKETENKKHYTILGHPATTFVGGEEGNYDYPIVYPLKKTITEPEGNDENKNAYYNIKMTYMMGEDGNPVSVTTTEANGEEGNPVYPQMTSTTYGEESTEFYGVIDHTQTNDYAGLGTY
jgi:hypothetical protein